MSDEDPRLKRDPMSERILRQWLKMESGAYTRPNYRANLDLALKGSDKLVKPAPCGSCDYVAETAAEIHWHEDRNHGHECCPDNVRAAPVPRCKQCARPISDECEHTIENARIDRKIFKSMMGGGHDPDCDCLGCRPWTT